MNKFDMEEFKQRMLDKIRGSRSGMPSGVKSDKLLKMRDEYQKNKAVLTKKF